MEQGANGKAQADPSLKTPCTIWTPILPGVVPKLQSGMGREDENPRDSEASKTNLVALGVQAKMVLITTVPSLRDAHRDAKDPRIQRCAEEEAVVKGVSDRGVIPVCFILVKLNQMMEGVTQKPSRINAMSL